MQNVASADPTADRIAETAAAGATVGITASAADPDAGDTVTYSVDDPHFAIDPTTGVITRSDTGILDATVEPTIMLTITAASSDSSTATKTYALSVVPEAPQVLFQFAVFGDFGDQDLSGKAEVAELVGSWNVDVPGRKVSVKDI